MPGQYKVSFKVFGLLEWIFKVILLKEKAISHKKP